MSNHDTEAAARQAFETEVHRYKGESTLFRREVIESFWTPADRQVHAARLEAARRDGRLLEGRLSPHDKRTAEYLQQLIRYGGRTFSEAELEAADFQTREFWRVEIEAASRRGDIVRKGHQMTDREEAEARAAAGPPGPRLVFEPDLEQMTFQQRQEFSGVEIVPARVGREGFNRLVDERNAAIERFKARG